jgi:membrane protein DedA with SNARE-associated domain
VLIARHQVGFVEATIAVQIGLLPANACLFWVGRIFGRRILRVPLVRALFGASALARARLAFRQSGTVIVALTRFTPLVRGPVYLAAGLSKISFRRFFAYDAAASCFQIPLLLWVGILLGHSSGGVLEAYRKIGIAMALLLGALVVTKIVKEQISKTLARPRLLPRDALPVDGRADF